MNRDPRPRHDQTPGGRARDWVGAFGSYLEWRPEPNFGVFSTTDTFPKYDFFT